MHIMFAHGDNAKKKDPVPEEKDTSDEEDVEMKPTEEAEVKEIKKEVVVEWAAHCGAPHCGAAHCERHHVLRKFGGTNRFSILIVNQTLYSTLIINYYNRQRLYTDRAFIKYTNIIIEKSYDF